MMNILLPTDFSANARNAAEYAMNFFRDTPCTFHLLHVLPIPADTVGINYLTTSPSVQQNFDELLNWLNSIKTNPDHSFKISFKADYLIEAIRQEVQSKNIDLILMGTKGTSNKQGVVIGKNTSDVMMKVKCPVLAISETTVYREQKEILFPTDYKVQYNEKMLSTLLNISSLSRASVRILELFNSEKEPSQEQLTNRLFLQNSLSPKIPQLQTFYSSKKRDTDNIFGVNEVDMIVMVAKNLNICQKLLKNHPDNQIPFIKQLPLLVLH